MAILTLKWHAVNGKWHHNSRAIIHFKLLKRIPQVNRTILEVFENCRHQYCNVISPFYLLQKEYTTSKSQTPFLLKHLYRLYNTCTCWFGCFFSLALSGCFSWTALCLNKDPDCVNVLLHIGHLYGFSPTVNFVYLKISPTPIQRSSVMVNSKYIFIFN